VFTIEDRDRVLKDLISLAKAAPDVTAAALVGSAATGTGDRRSDLDVALAVWGPVDSAVDRWTDLLVAEFGVVHHWDVAVGAGLIRVFLLASGLELDLGFYPEDEYGPRGPAWRTVFGTAEPAAAAPGWDPNTLIGHAWHHVLHAGTAIERDRLWNAEHWVSALRALVFELACRRRGLPAGYAKGAHLLPAEITDAVHDSLVRELSAGELGRALRVLTGLFVRELQDIDAKLAARLTPILDASLTATA
jgi:hypothetical protein